MTSAVQPSYTLDRLAAILDEREDWLSVRTAPEVPGPDWISCEQVLAAQQAGEDPTGWWRAVLETEYGKEYEIDPPRQVAAMFVLLWYVGVPAFIASTASALTGYSPDVSPAALAFKLHPAAHYPAEVALLPGALLPAEQAYQVSTAHCRAFADSYRSGVKLGTRQRYGAIVDEYRFSIAACSSSPHAADAARIFRVDPAVKVRDACCYIYALPGVTACSTCPRLVTPEPTPSADPGT